MAQWPVQVCRGLCVHVTMHGALALLLWGSGTEPQTEFRGRALFRGPGGFEKLSHYCHGVRLIWDFIATSHWKGPVDGVGEH